MSSKATLLSFCMNRDAKLTVQFDKTHLAKIIREATERRSSMRRRKLDSTCHRLAR
jgi:hypothetical protein